MKTFLIFNNSDLKSAMTRVGARCWGLDIVDSAKEAELILADHWIEPGDATKTYAYIGVRAAEHILPKWGNVLYPEKIPEHSNAFYVGIAEFVDVMPAMVRDRQAAAVVKEPVPQRVLVIVDDKEENLAEAKVAFPDAACFSKLEMALSFVQGGTADIIGVLTDLVMPIRPLTGNSHPWTDEEASKLPSGILMYMAAKAKGIPVVIVTAGHQQSPLEEYFVYTFAETEGIPLVNVTPKNSKAWQRAYEMLGV